FFFSSRRRHTRCYRDWSSDVCSSDLSDGQALCSGRADPVRRAVPGRGSGEPPRERTNQWLAATEGQGAWAVEYGSPRKVWGSRRSEERRVGKERRWGGTRDDRRREVQ